MIDRGKVAEALEVVEDPELGVDVVSLGLIYGLVETQPGTLRLEYSLTSAGCPAADWLATQMREAALTVDGVEEVEMQFLASPGWQPRMISEDALFMLGMIL